MKLSRRDLLAGAGAAAAASLLPVEVKKPHLITLSFDDGFEKSFTKTAEIHESFGLKACLNIIATKNHTDDYIIKEQQADWALWNELKKRGHEIMPHGYRHANLTEMPLTSAIDLVRACLDEFDVHLKGFDRSKAVFNFPYNASNKHIEEFVGSQVRALRTGYSAFNPLPHKGLKRLTCSSFGPENAERFLDSEIDKLLKQPSGWMIFNAHGLDDEGWGPISSDYLKKLLDRLTRIETVELLPAGMALARADSVIY